jgi:gamma-glutamyltranspeptidase/glutathione hydrolase
MRLERSHRPVLFGRRGAVASNHPVATQAGLDVLRAGGNAADAAVAVALTIGVVEPQMSGLGADGFYHFHDAATGAGTVHNGSGRPPAAVVVSSFTTSGMPLAGPASVSVPGAIGALHQMHQRHGRLAWSALCRPAIDAAREGFGATNTFRRFAGMSSDRLLQDRASTAVFLRDGEVPAGGEFIVQARLAQTLEELAAGGAESFYRGSLARRLVADFARSGVAIDASDLAAFEPEEQVPISIGYRGFTVRQTPPNSMGFTLLQELRIVEQFDLAACGFMSAEATHLLVEAKKLAFADRERFATDPRHRAVPLDTLLSDAHARKLAAKIAPDRAAQIPLRPMPPAGDNTTYFCVIDAAGNAVSAIQSLNNAFGSGVMAEDTGVLLNNRMSCWHLDDLHPNVLRPGKRVRHTMNAPMVLRNGKVWALFGTPGADDQVQVNLQVATGLIDFGIDPQRVVEAPRWSSNQPGQEANWPHGGDHVLSLEADTPAATLDGLRARGHALRLVPPLEGPCSVACIRVLDNGAFAVGSDPRRDGWGGTF